MKITESKTTANFSCCNLFGDTHTVWPLLYKVLGGWIFRREHAGSLVEQLLTGDHATHLQQLAIWLLTYWVLFGLDSFACILLCSTLVAIQDIRAAVFRFFQETTSYAGTQMVAAAFDAGKRHQDKMLLKRLAVDPCQSYRF